MLAKRVHRIALVDGLCVVAFGDTDNDVTTWSQCTDTYAHLLVAELREGFHTLSPGRHTTPGREPLIRDILQGYLSRDPVFDRSIEEKLKMATEMTAPPVVLPAPVDPPPIMEAVAITPEDTWTSTHTNGEPCWADPEQALQAAEARLRARISRTLPWKFCPTCQRNCDLVFVRSLPGLDKSRVFWAVGAYWSCAHSKGGQP